MVNYNYSKKSCNKIDFIRGKIDRSHVVRANEIPTYSTLHAGNAEFVKDIDPKQKMKSKKNKNKLRKNRAFYTKEAMGNAAVAEN